MEEQRLPKLQLNSEVISQLKEKKLITIVKKRHMESVKRLMRGNERWHKMAVDLRELLNEARTAKEAICGAFLWEDTPEGRMYWFRIAKSL